MGAAVRVAVAVTVVTVSTTLTTAAGVPIGAPQRPPGAVIEAVTASSTSVVASDGSHGVTLYAGPVRMARGGAEWLPIDLTLVAGPEGTVRPVAVPHDVALAPTGPVVRFAGGGSAALDWSGPLPAPRLEGHRATYPQARPGHDLVVEVTRAGFVASLRRTEPAAPPVPPLVLRRASGAVVEQEALDEPLVETDSAVSRVVAAAPVPGRTPAPFDTTVQTSVLRSDLSGDPDLRLGTYDGQVVARSLLTWDLAPLAGRPVASARLAVHQEWAASCRARGWEVWSASAAGPATRWPDQPAPERIWAGSTETRGHSGCAAGWTEVDVTDLVRSWVTTGAATGSVALRASDEGDPLGWKRFGSAEGPDVPRLEITLAR